MSMSIWHVHIHVHVHVHSAYHCLHCITMSVLRVSRLHIHVHIHSACLCPRACPCPCLSMVHVHVHVLSMVHVHVLSVVIFHVHAACSCPCCISLPMLVHIHVNVACSCWNLNHFEFCMKHRFSRYVPTNNMTFGNMILSCLFRQFRQIIPFRKFQFVSFSRNDRFGKHKISRNGSFISRNNEIRFASIRTWTQT
jgi:hypothetical protein